MKNATATSHGKKRFTAAIEIAEGTAVIAASAGVPLAADANGFAMHRNYRNRRASSMCPVFLNFGKAPPRCALGTS
jgi:hypothetical protein